MGDRCCLCATGCHSKRNIVCDLQLIYVCFCCVRLLFWEGVCEYGSDVLFVHQGDVFVCLPNVLWVSAQRTLTRAFALVFMLSVCGENLIFFHVSLRLWWACRCRV